MAFPTRGQVKGLFWQRLDDPAGVVFTDTANPSGAPSVFQAGFSEAYDLLFSNALNQQVPKVEQVVSGIIIPPSPVPFSVTPAAMGLNDFADWEWISERAAGSTEKFIDLVDEDRLTQRAPTDRLLETVFQNGCFNFVGCTTVREIQIKYVYSSSAPTDDSVAIAFDNSLAFLVNYSVGCMGGNKGYDEIANRCRSFAVGPRFDEGMIGGELFRLMQPLVRSRQNVQIAHKPYSTQRRVSTRWRATPYVAAQAGTTGGGAQNVPLQFSSANGTIVGAIDGANATFWLTLGVLSFSLFRNGILQSLNIDYTALGNQFTFVAGNLPQPGDILTAEGYPAYQQ